MILMSIDNCPCPLSCVSFGSENSLIIDECSKYYTLTNYGPQKKTLQVCSVWTSERVLFGNITSCFCEKSFRYLSNLGKIQELVFLFRYLLNLRKNQELVFLFRYLSNLRKIQELVFLWIFSIPQLRQDAVKALFWSIL